MSSDSGSTVVDSPLSITASVAGILTFVVALAAAAFVRIRYLSNADEEFYRIKGSLQWYKTESEFIGDLLNGAGQEKRREEKQYQMCAYVVDQLGKLEESLLSLLTEVEVEAGRRAEGKREEEGMGRGSGWTFVPEKWRGNTVVAVTWVSVRKEALELVRQREALGSRVLFAQLSMLSTRVVDLDKKAIRSDAHWRDQMDKLKTKLDAQNDKIELLEGILRTAVTPIANAELGFTSKHQSTVLVSRTGNHGS